MRSNVSFLYLLILPSLFNFFSFGCLTTTFYDNICPQALPTIKRVVEAAIRKEPRMGASLLRLHFHDCFVNGCDASVLLDDTSTFQGEKHSAANNNSARGFEVIDEIKSEVDKACCGSFVSCADILAVAARDSVVSLGGPTWQVLLGRRDSTTANRSAADAFLPSPFFNLSDLIDNFKKHNLNVRDLVALSGAHTIGLAQCFTFSNRIYNDTNIDPEFAALRKQSCPSSGRNTNLSPLESSPENFDNGYFRDLVVKKGLLHSDQELFKGGPTDAIVKSYVSNPTLFARHFAQSMIKMGNIGVLTGRKGQIRANCRRVNEQYLQ